MSKYIANKKFYVRVLMIALPIMAQNGISNFVNLLDNIMIGSVGTEPMSGVSIVNQLLFVFILCLFGAVSGGGILGAQYYGKGNMKGVRDVLRIKLIVALFLTVVAIAALGIFGEDLISIFLKDDEMAGSITDTLRYGKEYLVVMFIGLPPMAIEMSYSSTLRESGQTKIPMLASIAAVFVNLTLNYVLIFGHFGAPELGVTGAAIATAASRYIAMFIVVIWTHKHTEKNPYIVGLYKHFSVPLKMFGKVVWLSLPLLLNETLWAAGTTAVNSCYAQRGLSVVAALNIQSTIYNIFNIMFIAMGDSIAIIVGQQLGAGEIEEAKDSSRKIIVMSVFFAALGGLMMFPISFIFPEAYNTSDQVKDIAGTLIRVTSCFVPIHGFLHAMYFSIRSGGKTFITFLFDSCYMWVIVFPFAYLLSRFTDIDIMYLFIACQSIDLIKVLIGVLIYRSGVWAKNITV